MGVVISRRFYFLNHVELNKNMCAHKINFSQKITFLSGAFSKFMGVVISRFYFLNHIELNKNMCEHKINFSHKITLLSNKLFQIHICLLDLIKKVRFLPPGFM